MLVLMNSALHFLMADNCLFYLKIWATASKRPLFLSTWKVIHLFLCQHRYMVLESHLQQKAYTELFLLNLADEDHGQLTWTVCYFLWYTIKESAHFHTHCIFDKIAGVSMDIFFLHWQGLNFNHLFYLLTHSENSTQNQQWNLPLGFLFPLQIIIDTFLKSCWTHSTWSAFYCCFKSLPCSCFTTVDESIDCSFWSFAISFS